MNNNKVSITAAEATTKGLEFLDKLIRCNNEVVLAADVLRSACPPDLSPGTRKALGELYRVATKNQQTLIDSRLACLGVEPEGEFSFTRPTAQ